MRKASKALLIVGGIFLILSILIIAVSTVISFLLMQGVGMVNTGMGGLGLLLSSGALTDLLANIELPEEILNELIDISNSLAQTWFVSVIQLVVGVVVIVASYVILISRIVSMFVLLLTAIFCFASGGKKKGLLIANLILVVLIFMFFASGWLVYLALLFIIVGSILGLAAKR